MVRVPQHAGVQGRPHGREFIHIGRFEPTSQVCSHCGIKDGPKPLSVRQWTCGDCGTVHDRDVNAARNIAKAAGLAVSACGARVRPGLVPAPRREAGTHPDAAPSARGVEGITGLQARVDVKSLVVPVTGPTVTSV